MDETPNGHAEEKRGTKRTNEESTENGTNGTELEPEQAEEKPKFEVKPAPPIAETVRSYMSRKVCREQLLAAT